MENVNTCADTVLTGEEQMSADLNCTNNWEVLGKFCPCQKCPKNVIIRKSKYDYFYVNE